MKWLLDFLVVYGDLSMSEKVRQWTIASEEMECEVSGPSTDGEKVDVIEKAPVMEQMQMLVKTIESAIEYWKLTDHCKLNCDPSTGFHTAECCIERDFYKALAAHKELLKSYG